MTYLKSHTASTWLAGFESRWDALIFMLIVCISSMLLVEKVYFLLSVFGDALTPTSTIKILIANFSAMFALWWWLWFLLQHSASVLLRVHIITSSFVLCIFLRVIQSGEITTRQGVDFSLAEHLVLMVFGHATWKVLLFGWFIKLHLIIIFLLPLLFIHKHIKSPLPAYGGLMLFFILAFFPFNFNGVPASLAQNSLVYVVKDGWTRKDSIHRTHNTDTYSTFFTHHDVSDLSSDSQSEQHKNIVLIILESTGASMLDFYNAELDIKNHTPFLTEFASQSLKFTNTSALMTSTTKSLVSILCGIEPYIGLQSFDATLGIPIDCLPKRLIQAGYTTAYFQSAHEFYERRDLLVQHMGFETFVALESLSEQEKQAFKRTGIFGLEDRVLLSHNRHWLEQVKTQKKPFMATYLTLAQHHPYYSAYKDSVTSANTSARYQNNFVHSLTYIDGYLKALIEQYQAADLYDNTVFVVVGDHGEAFGKQHPQRFHNNNLYREGLWVPFFIVNAALFPEPVENHSLRSLMDVAPTLEDVLGFKISSHYRGISAFAENEHRRIYAACWYKERCLAAIDESYKYIYNFNDVPEELYLLKQDIWEQHNLAKQFPELTRHYREEVLHWYTENQLAYTHFYRSKNENYRSDPNAYYRFPFNHFADKLRITY